MDFNFKVPSNVPQDLLLIQDLIGTISPPTVAEKRVPDSLDSSDDSIASTDSEAESEDEVEAGLAPRDDDSEMSAVTSDSVSLSYSESDASSSSESERGREHGAPQQQISPDNVDDEESGMTAAAAYLQTKNEIVDANIMVPAISEVEPSDYLEKVGEIMSVVGNIVVVRGHPMDHVNSLSERALDAESLLVFEDRKVLGYIYETFGPTSQPLYQIKFNQQYPLDTDKVWVSREVFHVPQRSRFIFVDQLKKSRGSDASNIHDEEPAEDEIEFSDDEKEAAFRAERKRRHGRPASSSRQSTPATPRIHIDDMFQDIHCGPNPYDAHGPYDDDYHVTGQSRPPPAPYDDPYADVPTSDVRLHSTGVSEELSVESNCENGGDVLRASRGRISSRGARGRGVRNHQLSGNSRRGYHHRPVASQRTFDSDTSQFSIAPRMVERGTEYERIGNPIPSQSLVRPTSNTELSPESTNIQGYGQSFIQPHINPRFASVFGLHLPHAWAPQYINMHDHSFPPNHWLDTWSMHSNAGAEGEGDMYKPM